MKIIHSTAKAYLIEDKVGKFWAPISLCDKGDNNTIDSVYKEFKRDYIEYHPQEIEGEDIDFSPKVEVVPISDLSNIPVEDLERIYIPEQKIPHDIEYYQEDVRAGYEGTYAEWCSQNIPF